MSSSMAPSSGKGPPRLFDGLPGPETKRRAKNRIPEPEGNRKGPVSHEACDNVAREPVALQGGDERLDSRRLIGGKRGVGHGQKRNRHDKWAHDPVADAPLHDEIQEHDRPREKDQRLVEIGKRCMPDPEPVGLPPSNTDADGVESKTEKGRARGKLSPVLVIPQQANEIEDHGDEVDHRGPAEHFRVHRVSPQ